MTRQRRDVHVIAKRVRRWKVTQGGRTLSHHRTQETAVTAARRAARRSRVDLVTHGCNGRIRSKDSFGNDTSARDIEQ
jgi:Uncharacterized protein conserved in bacteria (DUF2188)